MGWLPRTVVRYGNLDDALADAGGVAVETLPQRPVDVHVVQPMIPSLAHRQFDVVLAIAFIILTFAYFLPWISYRTFVWPDVL